MPQNWLSLILRPSHAEPLLVAPPRRADRPNPERRSGRAPIRSGAPYGAICIASGQTRGMRYIRIYNGDDGVSRLDNGEITFVSEVFAPPAPPLGVSSVSPAQAMMFIRLPTGWKDAAHPSPARQWMFVLAGRGEVAVSGETRQWGPGDAFLVEDTSPPGHGTTVHDEAVFAVVRI